MLFFKKKPKPKAQLPHPTSASVDSFREVQVRQVEDLVAHYRNWNDSHTLAKYAHDLALDAAMFNAKNLACVPMRLYKRVTKSGTRSISRRRRNRLEDPARVGAKAAMMASSAGEIIEITDAAPLRILRRPDHSTTGTAWDVARWVDKQLFGEALLLHADGQMVRLMPEFARVQPDDDEFITGWYYGRDQFNLAQFTADEVQQMKWAEHPSNPYRGLGWLDMAIREIEVDSAALASEIVRWKNGGYPEGNLSFDDPKITQKQIDEAVRLFRAQLRSHDKLIVTAKSRYTPLAVAKDM